jgi:hypothetical protein
MKKYLISLAILLVNIYVLKAQSPNGLTHSQVSQQILSKPTDGNDKEIYSGYFSGLLNMVGTDGKSGIQISSTLYTIVHFKQISHNDSLVFGDLYQKQWLLRNIQLTAGFTPDNKDQFEVDAVSYGLKIALLNNKRFNQDQVNNLNQVITGKIAPAFDFMENYQLNHPGDAGAFQDFKRGKIKVKDLPKDFQDAFAAKFGIKKSDNPDDYFDFSAYYQILVKQLKTKPVFIISGNSNYNELKSQPNNYILSSTYAFYTNRDTSNQYSLTASHTWAADTATYKNGLVRNITEVTAGMDFLIAKWLEFKPALDFVNILGPLYKKENKNTGNIAVTPRIKINKNFWLPITFKYNAFQVNAHVQGQFSLQYSLK